MNSSKSIFDKLSIKFNTIFKLSKSETLGLFNSSKLLISQFCMNISILCLDNNGKVNPSNIDEILKFIDSEIKFNDLSLYQNSKTIQLIKNKLIKLKTNKELQHIINSLIMPSSLSNSFTSCKITMLLNQFSSAKRSIFNSSLIYAWLIPLRQSVGSCFATAVAIEIQENQDMNFFLSLSSAISSGYIKGFVDGEMFSAPLFNTDGSLEPSNFSIHINYSLANIPILRFIFSKLTSFSSIEDIISNIHNFIDYVKSSYSGNLITTRSLILTIDEFIKTRLSARERRETSNKDFCISQAYVNAISCPSILKDWEFALATFSETSGSLLERNLFISLGWNTSIDDGLGKILFNYLEERLNKINSDLEFAVHNYNQLLYAKNMVDNNTYSYGSDRGSGNYSAALKESEMIIKDLKEVQNILSNLLTTIYDMSMSIYKRLFIESYNPSLRESTSYISNDIKAGFCLSIKNKLDGTKATKITSSSSYQKSIKKLFEILEAEIKDKVSKNRSSIMIIKEIESVSNIIINYISSNNFIKKAFSYICKENHLPFDPSDPALIQKMLSENISPWFTPSGGTPNYLLKNIYGMHELPTVASIKNPKSIEDVLKFWKEKSSTNNFKSLFATSPSHMFRIFPKKVSDFDINKIKKNQIIKIDPNIYNDLSNILPNTSIRIPNSISMINKYICSLLEDNGYTAIEALTFSNKLIIENSNPIDISIFINDLSLLNINKESKTHLINSLKKLTNHNILYCKLLPIITESLNSLEEIDNVIQLLLDKHNLIFNNMFIGDTNWEDGNLSIIYNPISSSYEFWGIDSSLCSGTPILNWFKIENSDKDKNWLLYIDAKQYNKEIYINRAKNNLFNFLT